MGPHSLQADERVARRRLPQGYRAVLDDADRLWRVTAELLAYAVGGASGPRQRYGVLFRRASAADREVIRHKPISEFGAEELLGQAELFGIGEGYYYVLDSEGLTTPGTGTAIPMPRRDLDRCRWTSLTWTAWTTRFVPATLSSFQRGRACRPGWCVTNSARKAPSR